MSETPKNKKGGPVFGYLAIMFAVAFLMLLLAYFIQQRNNEVAMDGLRDSITSFESLDEVLDDNRQLREELAALEQELDALEEENATLQTQVSQLESKQAELEEALQRTEDELSLSNAEVLSWQAYFSAETYYQNKQYEECAQQMASIWCSNAFSVPEEALERYSAMEAALQGMGYDTRTLSPES